MKRESQILGEGEGVGDGEGECRYFYLGFTDSLEENTWVSVDTGLPMVGLTWAANQPNNFDNQAVFSTLIGRAPKRLGSYWSRAWVYILPRNPYFITM